MKQSALLELFAPGIVLFDPVQLAGFVKGKGLADTNIFNAFLAEETLGQQAIEQGVVVPIYQITEQDYFVFAESQSGEMACLPEPAFMYSGIPLSIVSGVLVVSDLNALLDWDEGFFLNYKATYECRLPNNDYIEVEPGIYSLSIRGYTGLQQCSSGQGYGLKFFAVPRLPVIADGADVSDLDFELTSL